MRGTTRQGSGDHIRPSEIRAQSRDLGAFHHPSPWNRPDTKLAVAFQRDGNWELAESVYLKVM